MKSSHIILAVLVLRMAILSPFAHPWSDTVSDLIDAGVGGAMLACLVVTAPFNRRMLADKKPSIEVTHDLALDFSLCVVLSVAWLLGDVQTYTEDALGLDGQARLAVYVTVGLLAAVAACLAMSRLDPRTHRRINAAYDAAEQRKARNGGAA